MTDYDTLLAATRQHDADAARALEPLARRRGDDRAVLACWRTLCPERARAWQALRATLKSIGGDGTSGAVSDGATAVVQRQVVAQMLVGGCREHLVDCDDPLTLQLIDLAERLLNTRVGGAGLKRLRAILGSVPVAATPSASLRTVALARSLLQRSERDALLASPE